MRNWKINIVFLFLLLIGAVIIYRLAYLQIVHHDLYRALAQGQQGLYKPVKGERGRIFFSGGQMAGINVKTKQIFIYPQDIKNKDSVSESISFILGQDKESILEKISRDTLIEKISNSMSEEQERKIKEMGFCVKLDTNGNKSNIIQEALNRHLVDYIAMDVKAPWERYGEVTKNPSVQIRRACEESFHIIQHSSVAHEFRTTILPRVHTEEDFFVMAGYLQPHDPYYIQNTKFETTLDSGISREIGYDVEDLVAGLRARFSSLTICQR